MSISGWFTPRHLGFLCMVIKMTTQLTKYVCHFTKGEYTTPYWLEGDLKEKMTWLDLTWRKNYLILTWLEQLCDLSWLDLKKEEAMTWLDSRLVLLTWLDLWLEQGWLVTTLLDVCTSTFCQSHWKDHLSTVFRDIRVQILIWFQSSLLFRKPNFQTL